MEYLCFTIFIFNFQLLGISIIFFFDKQKIIVIKIILKNIDPSKGLNVKLEIIYFKHEFHQNNKSKNN